MSTALRIKAVEYHGSCTEAGVVLICGDPEGRECAALILSDADRLLHTPSAPYRRNEGLVACASRALQDWTAGAIELPHGHLATAPFICSSIPPITDRSCGGTGGASSASRSCREASRATGRPNPGTGCGGDAGPAPEDRTAVFFIVHVARDTIEIAAGALARNAARDTLRGSRHPSLPRALVLHPIDAIPGTDAHPPDQPQMVDPGAAFVLSCYLAAHAPPDKLQ